MKLFSLLDTYPRRGLGVLALTCAAMLAFGMYLQHVVGLEPCPMCIVQRYALVLVALVAGLTALSDRRGVHLLGGTLVVVLCGLGAFVAARQSWLQWYPPEAVSCGRDLYGMIEAFPLNRVVPMLFRGSGDCSKVDWSFLGGSIANWSFVVFVTMGLVSLVACWRRVRTQR